MAIIPRISVWFLPKVFDKRYRLATWTKNHRLFKSIVKKIMFSEDDMIVIPKKNVVKDISVDINIDDAGDRTLVPDEILKGVIERSDEIFIMNFCLCRKSSKCKDYPVDRGCIFIGKGTRRIPDDFGRRVTKDEAKSYIDECSDLGLVHIIGRNKLDSIWLNTGNKKDLLTICNCCPCCCLWNVARDISDDIGSVYKKMDSVTVKVDTEKCVGCGVCKENCFTRAIDIIDGKSVINEKQCRGCGRCADGCSFDAISIQYDSKVIDKEIDRICELVNKS